MTFCSTATRLALRRLSAEHRVAVSLPGKRNFGYAASAVGGWYSLFGRSTGMYAAWIAVGIVGAEVVTGKITDTTWNTLNHGRTFETYDWSKFDQFEEDEDDDDEEEEEEEEEGDGDDDEDEDDDE